MIKDMDRYDRKLINERLKSEFRRYCDEYSRLSEAAKNDYLKSMKPGERVPATVALSGEYADRFQNTINSIKENVDSLLKPIEDKLEASITEAPSQDATNTIMLLSARKNIDQAEIDRLVNKYGDNVQSYNAIRDIASQHKIYLGEHPVLADLEAVKTISGSTAGFSVMNANNGKASPGLVSFIEMSIDNAFPSEE